MNPDVGGKSLGASIIYILCYLLRLSIRVVIMQCEVLELDLLEILYILKYLTRRIRGTNEIGMADPGRRVPGQGRQLVGLGGSVSENTIQGILLPQLLVHKNKRTQFLIGTTRIESIRRTTCSP